MTESVFPYPGGKSYLAPWIIEHFPDHYCYVEPFVGSAAVLANKPRSKNEVINDRDGDIVQFFEALRDRGDELAEWLDNVPYAYDVHQEWADEFYNGDRPDDPVERAGRFVYLRFTQYSGKYQTKSGFQSEYSRNRAQRFENSREQLKQFKNRFKGVQIENRDYEFVFDRFDSPETLFYCDPPYVEEGDALYTHGEFDHDRFVEIVEGAAGNVIISYMDVPEELMNWKVVRKDSSQHMNKGHEGRRDVATETLVMNYDPDTVSKFSGPEQTTLTGSIE